MPANHEINMVYVWLQTVLKGDTTLMGYATGGVWSDLAPPETVPPFVVAFFQAGTDFVNFGAGRAYSSLRFTIKAVGPVTVADTIASMAARIDTLLTISQSTAVTGGEIKSSYRAQPLEKPETVNGEDWLNLGGSYLILGKAS